MLYALVSSVSVPANDSRLLLEGRWAVAGSTATADWSCSTLRLRIAASSLGGVVRSERLNATVLDERDRLQAARISAHVLIDSTYRSKITLPASATLVQLQDVAEANRSAGPRRVVGESSLTIHGRTSHAMPTTPDDPATAPDRGRGRARTRPASASTVPVSSAVAELLRFGDCARSSGRGRARPSVPSSPWSPWRAAASPRTLPGWAA